MFRYSDTAYIVFIVELGALLAIVPDEFNFILENNIRQLYNWTSKKVSFNKKKIGKASDIFESDETQLCSYYPEQREAFEEDIDYSS